MPPLIFFNVVLSGLSYNSFFVEKYGGVTLILDEKALPNEITGKPVGTVVINLSHFKVS